MTEPRPCSREELENAGSNSSANPTLGDVLAVRLSRRDAVKGALAVSVVNAAIGPMAGEAAAAGGITTFAFEELASKGDDKLQVAPGYEASVLIRWGDRVTSDAPAFDPRAQSPASQAQQFGYNNDYLGFLPIEGSADHGLLVINHEYTNEELMFPGLEEQSANNVEFRDTTEAMTGIERMAHGGSVIEIKREGGIWRVVEGSKYARRITADTEMRLSGPAAGHARLKTSQDPSGTRVLGMLNNCAGGLTPWGTWLTCEENINYYFMGKEAAKAHPDAAAFKRYGVPAEAHAWGRYDGRFDIAKEPHEVNRFGWVVEIDPFNPQSVPVKRTAMGRFKHEGAGSIINKDGRYAVYQGDDERFDYVYRFVTEKPVNRGDLKANRDLLDHGTLSVARFNADGSGEWLPLVFGEGGLVAENGFADQGDVLIFARLAADHLKATKMDRPEDVEVSPKTGKVYVMLTNNDKRKTSGDKGVDSANPRPDNKYGHIIEITPDGGDHASALFRWDILVKCGDHRAGNVGATFNPLTSESGWFGMPDNCVFDAEGRLWISTDGNRPHKTGRTDGLYGLAAEGPERGTSKCFLRVPLGAELCGPCFTPDMETLFVAVQHPGEVTGEDEGLPPSTFDNPMTRWPDFAPGMPPRPSVVAITKKGGGKIGV